MSAETKPGARARGLVPGRLLNSGVSDFISSRSPGDRAPDAAGRSWSRSGEGEQIVGDHAQPDPPLHAARASVPAPPHPVPTFERADASFTAGAPAEGGPSGARALLAGLTRQHDVPDAAGVRGALVAARGKAAVGDGQVRRMVEERDVAIQRGLPEGALRLTSLTDRVVGDELRLGLLDFHQSPELGRLGQLAFADDLGMRLEEADHLAREVRIV